MVDDEQPDLSAFESANDTESDADAGADDSRADADAGADHARADDDVGADHAHVEGTEPETGEESDIPPVEVSTESNTTHPTVAELDRTERVELGVDLLAHVETESLSLSAAVDRIETVTTNPALTREILDTAELRGIIEREDGRIRTRRGGTYVRFERQVVKREGDYECRRCGAGLSTGHFVKFEAGKLGPFGPSCVKKVLGRE